MKKLLSFGLVFLMLCGIWCLSASAAEGAGQGVSVYVSIADATGKLALTQEKITVTDTDRDGALTVHDALYCAHEAKYQGGAAAGYGTAETQWGLSLSKLWGTANGGNYGYYVNHVGASGLTDPVEEGDLVNAVVYVGVWPDMEQYCYFDQNTLTAKEGDAVTLTLSAAGYDAQFQQIAVPVEGAVITFDGVATSYKTDTEGKVTVTLSEAGNVVIGAISDTQKLTPPSCVATVEARASTETGTGTEAADAGTEGSGDAQADGGSKVGVWIVCGILTVVVVAGTVSLVVRKRKKG
ncbi:MAG: hypothetical protein IJY47_04805 [Clostridia bacterium]|nr:hypothetical protein [Clostridia bacterium]